ncbi:kinase [uncultured Sphingomonas sp.]|uniref:kinase n=1 Tax=uncultured Sphingomonas sp. TaxID=158754 RepID=UPI0025F0F755|nr:kinase [uncultured Sphingomonas sp.]
MTAEIALASFVEKALAQTPRPLVVGLCGAQGSGKSTLTEALAQKFSGTAILSIDDLYLPQEERQRLARDVHPLFATRGVPGTHDVPLGIATLNALREGRQVRLPRFDKSHDDRLPERDWPLSPPRPRLVVFEGWCVGARPIHGDLRPPINRLERDEDPDATWRRTWNAALAADLPPLFAAIDKLALLAAPSWDVVLGWRREKEAALKPGPIRVEEASLSRFVSHYERLTRHILNEMTERADLVIPLAEDRSIR